MKTMIRTLAVAGVVAVGGLTVGTAPARAQVVGFGYTGPGVSVGVQTGGPYYYGGYYQRYAYMPPVVVGPPPVVVARPLIVARPVFAPRPVYYRGYYGPRRRYRW
jgi:hypothetical protein